MDAKRALKVVRIVLLVLGPLALIPLGSALAELYRARAAADWPVAEGVVESSVASRTCTRTCENAVELSYRYRVGEAAYVGSRIHFGDASFPGAPAAEAFAQAHPAGSTIEVRYDADHPDQSALVVGEVGPRTWLTGFAALVAYALSWLAYAAIAMLLRAGVA